MDDVIKCLKNGANINATSSHLVCVCVCVCVCMCVCVYMCVCACTFYSTKIVLPINRLHTSASETEWWRVSMLRFFIVCVCVYVHVCVCCMCVCVCVCVYVCALFYCVANALHSVMLQSVLLSVCALLCSTS